MADLGKNPKLYGLRSIRRGSTTNATDTRMPEVFLRASGGWKGRAMEVYREDCLPGEQQKFARALGHVQSYGGANDSSISSNFPSRTCSAQLGRAGVNSGNQIPRRTLNLSGGDSPLADGDAQLEDPVSMRLYSLFKDQQPR